MRVHSAYTVTMNKKQKTDLSYLLWTLLPLAVGGLSALISADGMKNNALLPQPALQPPPWVFITAWTILYLLMGLSAGLVWNAVPRGKKDAMIPFYAQLVLNFLWSPLFFALELRLAAFFVLSLSALALLCGLSESRGIHHQRLTPHPDSFRDTRTFRSRRNVRFLPYPERSEQNPREALIPKRICGILFCKSDCKEDLGP